MQVTHDIVPARGHRRGTRQDTGSALGSSAFFLHTVKDRHRGGADYTCMAAPVHA
jgi:hypothetical protein